MEYWRQLSVRYAEHLSDSMSEQAVPYMIAAGRHSDAVDFYLRRKETGNAMIAAKCAEQFCSVSAGSGSGSGSSSSSSSSSKSSSGSGSSATVGFEGKSGYDRYGSGSAVGSDGDKSSGSDSSSSSDKGSGSWASAVNPGAAGAIAGNDSCHNIATYHTSAIAVTY